MLTTFRARSARRWGLTVEAYHEPTADAKGGFFMAKKRFFYYGESNQALRDIKRLIRNFNTNGPTVLSRLEFSPVVAELELSEKTEDFERHILKINDPHREEDAMAKFYGINNLAGIFVLLPHGDRTMIEFNSTDRMALHFWNELTRDMPGENLSSKAKTESPIENVVSGLVEGDGDPAIGPTFVGLQPEAESGNTPGQAEPPTKGNGAEQAGGGLPDRGNGDEKPWGQIPDYRWDRAALELWHEGYTCDEIAGKIDKDVIGKTVRNRLTQLRGLYKTGIVPKDKQRKKSG